MAPPSLLTLPTDALIITLRLISKSDTTNLRRTCRYLSKLPVLATDSLDMEGIELIYVVEPVPRIKLDCAELPLMQEISCDQSNVQILMIDLPKFALNTILKYISPSDTLSFRQTCQAFRTLPMLSDSRLYRSWHTSAQQSSPFPLTSLKAHILETITDNLYPSDRICLRLTCYKFRDLAMPDIYELTEEEKDGILLTIEDKVKRSQMRKLLNRASWLNGEIMENWRIPGYLNEERQIAQRRYEHDYGRAKKTLPLLFCNKCGKIKKAHHTTGFADGSSGLSVAVIKGRECIPCRVGRFDNLRVASIYLPVVNGLQMFACFLCKEARPLGDDGLELWQSLDRKELEANLVRGVALVEHKFCKTCFENRKDMKLEGAFQEVDYSKLITMMERMFPKMGKLDAASVEKEERRKAEEEQRYIQEELRKQAEEEAKKRLLEEQEQKAKLEEQIGSKMEDLELVDWDEEIQELTSSTQTSPVSCSNKLHAEHNNQTTCNTDHKVSRNMIRAAIEAPITPPPRPHPEGHPIKLNTQLSSPILAAHSYNDDDVFGGGFDIEDLKLDQAVDTPFTSDDTAMDDAPTTKDTEAEDEFGWSLDMEGMETRDITDAMPTATVSTSDMDRMMFGGTF